MLNSADRVFRELRDLSFAAVGPRLGERAKAIQADYKDSKVRECQRCHGKFLRVTGLRVTSLTCNLVKVVRLRA